MLEKLSDSPTPSGNEVETMSHRGLASQPQLHVEVDTCSVDERKLLRKLDFTLIPWLALLYLLSFLDRTSIGNARLYGLENDLHITDKQYSLCLTTFFFSYAFFEVPSNIFLKRFRPSIWLSSLMLLWGVMMTLQGIVQSYHGLLITRWMLGVFEAGLYPGVSYYLSCWYKHSEYGKRLAIFFSAATVSGAFGGLLAAAISNMHGVGGKPGWAWIFILEGIATVIAGVISFWMVQDFPDNAKFLTEAERAFVIRRLQEDDQFSAAGEKFKRKYIWMSFADWKTWIAMVINAAIAMPLYSFALFLPSIIEQLGFQATPANLLTVPVYVCACGVTCAIGILGDRLRQRGYIYLACSSLGVIGYIILISSRKAALSYIAVYLAACGIYSSAPNLMAWVSDNVEGSYKRSVTMAMVVSFGNFNSALSANVYPAKDKPHYSLGHGLVLMYITLGMIAAALFRMLLKMENERRDRGERDEIIEGSDAKTGEICGNEKNGRYASVEEARREKGDQWSGYRYAL